MKFGILDFVPILEKPDLVSKSTQEATNHLEGIMVAEIDPEVSDTAAFCEKYQVLPVDCVNCVVVEAKRGDEVWYAACMIPANKRVDVNGIVRKHLGARKISFAPRDTAVSLTGMEFGAITPIGLPEEWPILVDTDAANLEHAIIGSGIRKSKLLVNGKTLSMIPKAEVLNLTKYYY